MHSRGGEAWPSSLDPTVIGLCMPEMRCAGKGAEGTEGCMPRGLLGLVALAIGFATSTVSADPATLPDIWMVATGMGGCAEVSEVAGQIRDLPQWSGPEDFVNTLRRKGLQVSTVTAEYHGRYIVKVVVPSRQVDTVFIPLSLCREMFQEELNRTRK
jgi:hypothetical protein